MEKFVSARDIAERIEVLIDSRSLAKTEFLKKMGISSANIGDWKAERSTPNIHKLVRVAEYFGVSLDWLVTGKDPLAKEDTLISDTLQLDGLSDDEKVFLREYIAFTTHRKKST